MSKYYTEKRARRYNVHWRTFTERSLAMVMTMIDAPSLHTVLEQEKCPPRVLDVACGTGILLQAIIKRVPEVEVYGVDASHDMVAQATMALKEYSHVQLQQALVRPEAVAGLPFAPGMFDLVTCTNALHDMMEPLEVLRGLGQLLVPGGQLVLEDYARREPAFPWAMVDWLAHSIEGGQGHASTLAEAQEMCTRVGLSIDAAQAFHVNWLWHNWVLSTRKRAF